MAQKCVIELDKANYEYGGFDAPDQAEAIILKETNLAQLLADQAECERLRKALKRISSIVETGQGCSINNHEIAVICLDIL